MDWIIIDKLKELRKNKNITQEQLAEKLNISRAKVSSWETNRRDMSITEAIKLANIYETSLDCLFEMENITEKQYIDISEKFIKNDNVKLDKKVRIVEGIINSLKENNVDKFYEIYKMTQNATK